MEQKTVLHEVSACYAQLIFYHIDILSDLTAWAYIG